MTPTSVGHAFAGARPSPRVVLTGPSRLGDRGPAVAEIRDRLVRIGLLDVPGDDDFDAALDLAVRIFQQSRDITVDGVVGPETFRRLEEARWNLGYRVLSYAAGHLVGGDDVAQLQQRLTDMGFDCGRVDGLFGPLTDRALREFQRGVGLDPDGTCGPATFKALDRLARTVVGGTPSQLRESLLLSHVRTGVADKVIVLDAGHGGTDTGNLRGGLSESALTADIAARVEGRLAAIGSAVLLTHGGTAAGAGPDGPDEPARAAFCNATGADLVVSLHIDALPGSPAAGLATFYYGGGRYGASSVLGERAATLLHDEVLARTGLADCRTHAKTWDLLRLTRMPAVRLELGYLTHEQDAARLGDPAFRDRLAEALHTGIVRFFAPEALEPVAALDVTTRRDPAAAQGAQPGTR